MPITKYGITKYVLLLVLLAPGVQYLPMQLDQLRAGETFYFSLGDEQLLDVGWWRYSKDVILALFSVAWPWLVLRSRSRAAWSVAKQGMVAEALVIVLGLLGHLVNPVPELILAGLRWPLLVHASLGAFCLGLSERMFSLESSRSMVRVLFVFLLYCVGFATLQWRELDFVELVGLRLTGVFASAPVFGFAMLGIALYMASLRNVSALMGNAAMFLALLGSALSGTRGAMLGVVLLWATFLGTSWGQSGRKKGFTLPMLALFLAVTVVFLALPQIEFIADRGGIIEYQLASGGRLSNLLALVDLAMASSLGDILFGQGLGYGTNSGFILFPYLVDYTGWNISIDNTFGALFLQLGLVGLLLVIGYAAALARRTLSLLAGDALGQARLGAFVGVLILATFSGNVLESHLFLPFVGLAVVNLVGERLVNRTHSASRSSSRAMEREKQVSEWSS